MNDGQFLVWGKNDFGQLGVGAGIGIDLVESENLPKEVELIAALPEAEKAELPLAVDCSAGMRTMMVVDSKNRLFQTGLKIDWNVKFVNLNRDRIEGKIELLACGRNHYVFTDSGNNLHSFGTLFKKSLLSEEQYDGYGIYDGDELFEGGKIVDLQMKYETFGVLTEDK
jgi:alpha-tubulin suppressor-like RCC1 family protein